MKSQSVRREGKYLIYEVKVEVDDTKSMLEQEQAIQDALNEAGRKATVDALKKFDVSGSPLSVGGVKYTSKGLQTEKYECPYGRITVERQVYQNSCGGKTFCPMENAADMILNSTPRFARTLSFKYGRHGALAAAVDLEESNGRVVCKAYIQNVSEAVGEIAQFYEKEVVYELPEGLGSTAQIAISLDGTCMLMCESGWREAMTGTISFYGSEGKRLHTIYIGAAPEHGKSEFMTRFEREIECVKASFRNCHYVGLADGAVFNWEFLEKWTDESILDFYHASEYVKLAANTMFPGAKQEAQKKEWLDNALHCLKHKNGAAKRLLNEFTEARLKTAKYYRPDMDKVITYFSNHYRKMNYARQTKMNMPIGSGVVEAACKELIKQRMANSGMRWKDKGAAIVISIRSLILSNRRWKQFWDRISESGCPAHKKFQNI